MSDLRFFGQLTKVEELDDGTLEVAGVASSERRDDDPKAIAKWGKGEKITAECVRKAIPGYLRFGGTGPLREMHQLRAAGRTVGIFVDDAGYTQIRARVVDTEAVKKVRAGVYVGFSLGGSARRRNSDDPSIIEEMDLTEVSLVDRPANPDATISLWKADGTAAPDSVAKGDTPGHPFRGNQFSEGEEVQFDGASADGKVTGMMPVKVVNAHSNAGEMARAEGKGKSYREYKADGSRHLRTATVENERGKRFEAYHHTLRSKTTKAAEPAPEDNVSKTTEPAVTTAAPAAPTTAATEAPATDPATPPAVAAAAPAEPAATEAPAPAAAPAGDPAPPATAAVSEPTEKAAAPAADPAAPAAPAEPAAPAAAAPAADPVAKVGRRFSKLTKAALAAHADALAKCHDALGKAKEAFGGMGWREEEDDAADGAADEAAEGEAAPAAEKEPPVAKAAEPAAAPDVIAKAARVDEVEKVLRETTDALTAVRTERDEIAKTMGLAKDALQKVIGEREQLAKALATANQRLAEKGVLRVVGIEKANDTGVVVEEEEDTSKIEDPVKRAEAELKKVYRSGTVRRIG